MQDANGRVIVKKEFLSKSAALKKCLIPIYSLNFRLLFGTKFLFSPI
jgi:hypothetical protein